MELLALMVLQELMKKLKIQVDILYRRANMYLLPELTRVLLK
jgi:hypothetical protein